MTRLLRLTENAIERPRLADRLEAGLVHPLTTITAPAGAGKTVLLAQWAARRRHPLAWLSLEEADREPRHALARLAAALAPICPNAQATVQAPVKEALIELLNSVAPVPAEIVVVLDNSQAVEGSPLAEAAGQLLDYLPPQVHLFVAGRHELCWPLARLRVRGQLLEITGDELRFTPEETAVLLRTLPGLAPAADQAESLCMRCEGWAMGLRLAATTLLGEADPAAAIAAFSGRHPSLASYFQAEVLAHEPENVQAFLRQTSVLHRLCAGLCNAVTGRCDGQQMLEWLERRNLFVVPLDGERCWYRYQQLFAEFLHHTLMQSQPGLEAELRSRAAAWRG